MELKRTPGKTYYQSSISEFVKDTFCNDLLNFLTESDEGSEPSHLAKQQDAWKNQIRILKRYLIDKTGYIIFEFSLSRVNMRIDVVLLMDGIVYSLEFKNNNDRFEPDDIEQASAYGYALKNFYESNRDEYVVPILIATRAPDSECSKSADLGMDKLFTLFKANTIKMEEYIDSIRAKYGTKKIYTEEEFQNWINSPFKPNPTIIESARSIFSNHKVEDINKFDAGEENLKVTESTVASIVKEAKEQKKKIICFVSGVPGAGKTLVGLDLAGKARNNEQDTNAVFFSGNGPLINVLTEALGRDAIANNPEKYSSKYKAVNDMKSIIQDLHAFKREIVSNKKQKVDENVLIFDEAQRVWDEEKLTSWLSELRANRKYYGLSEADLLLNILNEKDWGVIVALVGLGQDIYVGENGLGVWFKSLLENHKEWDIRLSKEIFEQTADNIAHYKEQLINNPRVKECSGLYLKTSIRTPRAKNLTIFIEALLNNEPEKAKKALAMFDNYPICLTRDLRKAEDYIYANKLINERCGKLVSSSSRILGGKYHPFWPIDNVFIAKWMLDDNGADSSNSLRYAATEFNIQGLEIDWSVLGWDMDMYYSDGQWHEQRMLSSRFFQVSTDVQKKHILNAYRVLLSRARKGLVIYIPKRTDVRDIYGVADYYDSTYEYLKSCGIKDLEDPNNTFKKIIDAIRLV